MVFDLVNIHVFLGFEQEESEVQRATFNSGRLMVVKQGPWARAE
jgi:hypothetical protein